MLILCTEHNWTEQEYLSQSDLHIEEMLRWRSIHIAAQNAREKRAKRRAKKG